MRQSHAASMMTGWFLVAVLVTLTGMFLSACGNKQEAQQRVAIERVIEQGQSVVSDPHSSNPHSVPDVREPHWPFSATFFYTDQHHIRRDQVDNLDRMAAHMRGRPSLLVELNGMADERGSKSYNMELAYKRAEAVRDYLIREGVRPINLVLISQGETPGDLASNRRTDGQIIHE